VEKSLEVKRSVAVVGDNDCGVEALAVERNAVDKSELVGPESLEVVADALRGQAKVELDTGAGALTGGLSKELPS
jgi:hypothetical protein